MHFTVLVVGDNPDKLLAPYQENNMGTCPEEYLNEEGWNPNSKWDWYVLGGRWDGFLLDTSGNRVNTGKKKDMDFYYMMNEAGKKAGELYDKVMAIWHGLPAQYPIDHFRNKATGQVDRAAYNKQPRLVALETSREAGSGLYVNADDFLVDRDTYVENAKINRICTYAFLDKDGWVDKYDVKEDNKWNDVFLKKLKAIEPDSTISVFDCHV